MFKRHLQAIAILFVAGGFFLPSPARADIYRYTDEQGVLHLTNVPTNHTINYVLVYREKRVLFNIKPTEIVKYDVMISKAAEKYKVDPALVKAIIKTESNFNHKAVSPKGAQGLMQLMPRTAHALQVEDSFKPENNIEGGVRYLRYLLNLFEGNTVLALAAYNAGENAVIKYGRTIPPYRETVNYVQRVLDHLDRYNNQ